MENLCQSDLCSLFIHDYDELCDYLTNDSINKNPDLLIISNCERIRPRDIKGAFLNKFENVKYLYLNRCEKNFVYFWTHSNVFKSLEELYLINSHPCEPSLFLRDISKIYLSDHYSKLVKRKRWGHGDNVKTLEDSELDQIAEFIQNEFDQ